VLVKAKAQTAKKARGRNRAPPRADLAQAETPRQPTGVGTYSAPGNEIVAEHSRRFQTETESGFSDRDSVRRSLTF